MSNYFEKVLDKFSVREIYYTLVKFKKKKSWIDFETKTNCIKILEKFFKNLENLKKFSTQFYERFLKNQNPR